MLVVSRDGEWLARLELIARRGGWPFEARATLSAAGRAAPHERALAVLDRALAGAAPGKAVSALRALYPAAAIIVVCDSDQMGHDAVLATVSSGCDDVIAKGWSDAKLAPRLAELRDRSLAAQARFSADGALKAERRAHRAHVKSRGRWRELALDAGGFALLWRLLEREGEPVSRDELAAVLAVAAGRELDAGTVTRRLAALKKILTAWPGAIESARGGLYRLVSANARGSVRAR